MKSYDELKAEMEAIQHQMIEALRNKLTCGLKEMKHFCKGFGFTSGILKISLTESRKNQ